MVENNLKTEKEAWYVVVTEENLQEASKWRGVKLKIGDVTGMYDWGRGIISKEYDHYPRENYGKEISTQEFYRKIGKLKSTNYEIYY